MRILFKKSYDESGLTATKGKLISSLQNELKNHPYLSKE